MEEETSRSGVGMLLGKNAQKALVGYNPVSDRILLARFKSFVGYLVVIQIYAPTSEAPQQDIDSFYCLLQSTVNEQKHSAFNIMMGDFNAKVGADWANAGGSVGKFGIGDGNEAGDRLI